MHISDNNPLKNSIRKPKIFIRLPSDGRYNKDGIDFSVNKDVAVRAMTASDEIMQKNPDALLNGSATEILIKSCVPSIKNVKETPMNDIDALLFAIRYATIGDSFEFKHICPHCVTETKETLSIRAMIDSMSVLPEVLSVDIDDEIAIVLRPYSFETSTKAALIDFDSQIKIDALKKSSTNIDVLRNEGKEKEATDLEASLKNDMNEIFKKLVDDRLDITCDVIVSIVKKEGTSQDGKPLVSVVTDKQFIKEYIAELDPINTNKIQDAMKAIMAYGVNKMRKIKCSNEKCNQEFESEVGINQSNFFELTSQN